MSASRSNSNNSSTTSDLLRKSKEEDPLARLQENAQQAKKRISLLLDEYKNSTNHSSDYFESIDTNASSSVNEAEFDDADEFIANKRKSNDLDELRESEQAASTSQTQSASGSVTLKEVKPEPNRRDSDRVTPEESFEFESTTMLLPPSGGTPTSAISASNRRSIISDYAPSIHEVEQSHQVAYVVDLSTEEFKSVESPGQISRKPSVVRVTKKSSSKPPTGLPDLLKQRPASLYEQKDQSVSHEQFRIKSPSTQSLPTHQKKQSMTSNPSTQTTEPSKYQSSFDHTSEYRFINDENIGESSVSHEISGSVNQNLAKITRDHSLKSTDSFDYNEGDILETKKHESAGRIKRADLNSAVDYDSLPIPSRSPNRPVSGINFTTTPILSDKILAGHAKSKSVDVGALGGVVIDDLIGKIDDEIDTQLGDEDENEHKERSLELPVTPTPDAHGGIIRLAQSTPRPLPPPPLPQHTTPITPSGSYQAAPQQDNDDGFVTEDENEVESKTGNLKPRNSTIRHKHRKPAKHQSKVTSVFDKNHFNHDTLVQLLQITNGTIIGQEFQNLGLASQEKQLLERLVDSLSRLTADMIVDEDRHDESVKRLNKAIKALEGF